MKTAKIKIHDEALGRIRTGFSGAYAQLDKDNKGQFIITFFSAKGKTKKNMLVEAGQEYVVGPNWIKHLPPVEKDNYYPRRWSREFGHVAHMSYFVIMNPGDEYEAENLGYTITLQCPEKLNCASFKPLNGFGFGKCLINKQWLATATYPEFCFRMDEYKRQYEFHRFCEEYASAIVDEYKAANPGNNHLSIIVADQEIRAGYRSDGMLCLAYRTRNVVKKTHVWTIEGSIPTASMSASLRLAAQMSQAAKKLLAEKTVDEVKNTVSWSVATSDEISNI